MVPTLRARGGSGAGRGTSATFKTSIPPYSSNYTAFTRASDLLSTTQPRAAARYAAELIRWFGASCA